VATRRILEKVCRRAPVPNGTLHEYERIVREYKLKTKRRDVSRTNLREAKLHGARLSATNLYRANLSGANLAGATLRGLPASEVR